MEQHRLHDLQTGWGGWIVLRTPDSKGGVGTGCGCQPRKKQMEKNVGTWGQGTEHGLCGDRK